MITIKKSAFKALKKQGDKVNAEDTVIEVDFNKVDSANHPRTTMIIVTEPKEGKTYDYIDFGSVKTNQIISK